MWEDRLEQFARERLGGRPVPVDLRVLLESTWNGDSGPIDELGLSFLEPGVPNPMLDVGYLNETDWANPDIAANVAAIQEVARYVGPVAITDNGDLLGYWLHPDQPADRPLRTFRYDTEGQCSVFGQCSLAETIVITHLDPDDESYAAVLDDFERLGVPVSTRDWAELEDILDDDPHFAVTPGELHSVLYEAEKARRAS
jgi:hypothetical protein